MAENMWIYWTIFAAYLTFLVIAGIRSKRKTKNLSDFLVAGRSIGPIMTGLSFGATYFSASLLIGSGSYAFRYGLSVVWIGLINAIVGIGVFMALFGNRTRALSKSVGCLTVPELLAKRYQNGTLQSYTAIVTLIFEVLYLVAVYMGLSTLFTAIMPDLENAYIYAVGISGIITIVYLNIGGSHGAIVTDAFESLIMVIGVLVILVVGLMRVGGFEGMNSILETLPPAGRTEFPGLGGFTVIGMILVSSFGVWGTPQLISRYFTSKDRRSLKWGLVISMAWGLFVALFAYFNANLGVAYLIDHGIPFDNVTGNNVVPVFMLNVLNPVLAAFFIAAVTAASLTTGEKIILVATSAVSRDVYQRKSKADDNKTMKITKLITIIIVVLAVVIAMLQPPAILALTFFTFSSMSAVFLVPYIYGLYWKNGTGKAALITGIIGLIINVFWFFCINASSARLNPMFPLLHDLSATEIATIGTLHITFGSINEFIPVQIIAFILFPIISKFTKKPDKELIDKIFADMKSRKLRDVAITEKSN